MWRRDPAVVKAETEKVLEVGGRGRWPQSRRAERCVSPPLGPSDIPVATEDRHKNVPPTTEEASGAGDTLPSVELRASLTYAIHVMYRSGDGRMNV